MNSATLPVRHLKKWKYRIQGHDPSRYDKWDRLYIIIIIIIIDKEVDFGGFYNQLVWVSDVKQLLHWNEDYWRFKQNYWKQITNRPTFVDIYCLWTIYLTIRQGLIMTQTSDDSLFAGFAYWTVLNYCPCWQCRTKGCASGARHRVQL